uniref:Uncharacterized protein LOC111105611 n=1 Tax=Crassostrea virginica TaxID=6565 RepID=A0A8B8AZC7_CRAVI|nr:uncharacterized protein LOC111105611 [Crassostrea virginica]
MALLRYLKASRATTGAVEISILFLLLSNYAEGQPCIESKPTLAVVDHCPLTAEEWASAAENKHCHALESNQKCVDPHKFVYHCLLNENNVSVEVCAPIWGLSGFCGYYDTTVNRIIMDGKKDCTKIKGNPCPGRFNSTDIFKYPVCYNIFEEERSKCMKGQSSNATFPTHNLTCNKRDDTLLIIILIIVIVIVILILSLAMAYILKRRRRKRHDVRQNDNSVETQPLRNTSAMKREKMRRDIGRFPPYIPECDDSDTLDEDPIDEFQTMDENVSPIDDSGVSNTESNTCSSQSFPENISIKTEFVGDQTNQIHCNANSRNGSSRSKPSTYSGASRGTIPIASGKT